MGQKVIPVDRAGLYVPGGTATYPSTVLMDVIPAKIAGVKEVILTTPPGRDGKINPAILAAANVAGADRIVKIGGAQAIAALAFGTESVPRVDKIVGPGNAYVAEAKRQVYGMVSIDMIAGPSEILVAADGKSNPAWLAADLLSQAEHDKVASAVLVTDSMELAEKVRDELERQRKESMAAEQVLQEQTTEEMIPEEDAGEESFGLVEQVRLYIDQNMEDPAMDRKSIAEAVHLNPDYLSFLFHKETGKVLSSYITEKRIELAKKLLVTTDRTLAEIGEQAGFSNNPYFHRQFKKLTGMTPTTYREQNRRKS